MSEEPEENRRPAKIALELMTHSDDIESVIVVYRMAGEGDMRMLWSGLASKYEAMGALLHALLVLHDTPTEP